jgi:hypothetical protein
MQEFEDKTKNQPMERKVSELHKQSRKVLLRCC